MEFTRTFFPILISLYLLVVGVEFIVTPDHTQSRRHTVELLWIRDRSVAETST